MKTGISVADICHQSPTAFLVVSHNTSLREVVAKVTDRYHTILIFVTDDAKRLHGIVRHDDLHDWVRLQYNLLPSNGRL